GGRTAVRFVEQCTELGEVCVIVDTVLHAPGRPLLVTATRGIASLHISVSAGHPDIHSGTYAGVAVNAATMLARASRSLAGTEAGLPEVLRAGMAPPSEAELQSWRGIAVDEIFRGSAVRPEGSAAEVLSRLWAEPAVDVHGFSAGLTETELNVV